MTDSLLAAMSRSQNVFRILNRFESRLILTPIWVFKITEKLSKQTLKSFLKIITFKLKWLLVEIEQIFEHKKQGVKRFMNFMNVFLIEKRNAYFRVRP